MNGRGARGWHGYPYAFALFPLVHLFAANPGTLTWGRALGWLGTGAVITWVATAGLGRLLHSRTRGGVFWSGIVLICFSYTPIRRILGRLSVGGLHLVTYPHVVAVALVALVALAVVVSRLRPDGGATRRMLNVTALLLVLMPLATLALGAGRLRFSARPDRFPMPPSGAAGLASAPKAIFYIVLDTYPSADTLREYFGFDNGPFLAELRTMGFAVPSFSAANYPLTFLSMASSLNMSYLDGVAGPESSDESVPTEMIRDSDVVRLVKHLGYEVVWVSSGWEMTRKIAGADRTIECGAFGEFEQSALSGTLLAYPLAQNVKWRQFGKVQRVPCSFQALRDLAPGPKRVFAVAHITAPHPPFLLGARTAQRPQDIHRERRTAYRFPERQFAEMRYLNGEVTRTVQAILKNWGPNVIIVLQGDHGSRSTPGSLERPGPRLVRERTRILNALYLPPTVPGDVPAILTPVNTFRLIFQRYFGLPIAPLPDHVFFSGYKTPYHYQEIPIESLR